MTTLALMQLGTNAAGAGLKYNALSKKADAISEQKAKAMEADYKRATEKNDFLMKESAKKSAQIGMERTEQNIRASQSLAKTRGKTNKLQGQSKQAQSISGQIGSSASITSNDIMRQESESLAAQMYNNEVANMNLNNKATALAETSVNQFTDMRTTGGGGSPNLAGAALIGDTLSLLASEGMKGIFEDLYSYPDKGSLVDLGKGAGNSILDTRGLLSTGLLDGWGKLGFAF